MDSDFRFEPPTIFEPILAKNLGITRSFFIRFFKSIVFLRRIEWCQNKIERLKYCTLLRFIHYFLILRPEGGGGGGGVNVIFSVFTCDRAAEDEQVEKNRIKIRPFPSLKNELI